MATDYTDAELALRATPGEQELLPYDPSPLEKQKESMLSTPYFISDLDGKFSIGEINSPEEREEAKLCTMN